MRLANKYKNIDKLKIISCCVIIIMILTKSLGFLRDIKITTLLGASVESDAFNIAYLLAITIFGFISSAYGNSLMPILAELYLKDKKKLEYTIGNIMIISTMVGIIIIISCWLFPKYFVKLIAFDVSFETIKIACTLVKISIISILLLLYSSLFSIILRIYDKNIVPTLGDLIFPIPIVIALSIGVKDIHKLIWFVVLGYFLQVFIKLIYLLKLKLKFTFIIDFKDKNLHRIIKLMPPILISTGLLQINSIIDNQVAASFGTGNITMLSLASKIYGLAYAVFATSLMQLIYAALSKAASNNDKNDYEKVVQSQISIIMTFIIPCVICLLIWGENIITILFVRDNFTLEAGDVTAKILMGYSVGLIFYVIRDICNYIFYSHKNTRIPAKISAVAIVINIILNLVLTKFIGIEGVSYATSISAIIAMIMLLIGIKKCFGGVRLFSCIHIIKFLLGGIIMYIVLYSFKNVLENNLLSMIVSALISFIIYLLSLKAIEKIIIIRTKNI